MTTFAKPLAFRIGAVLLPIILLLMLEAVLRFAGVADDAVRPFRSVEGYPGLIHLNPGYTQRYFGSFSPGVTFNPFHADKSGDTFRVFAFGGSTTAGFPNDDYAFPALLQARLESFLPGLKSEVVNLALTATNSYTVRDLSRDVVHESPDAIVIYAGHNEYYGAFGAGTSVNRLGNVRWLKNVVIRLKRSVLYTLLETVLARLRPPRDVEGRTMMAEAIGNASIPLDGDVFREGVQQFQENLAAAVRRFCDVGVPVYVGTLVANLADQPPLGEDTSADDRFRAGVERRRLGRYEEARARFVEARDYDDLRFRAPSEINRVIRDIGESTCATVVETVESFRGASPDGIEDNSLFVDHLHPNVRGHGLLAEAFFDSLVNHPRLRDRVRLSIEPVDSAVDPLGAAIADLRISRLKLGHPFTKGFTPEQEAERFRSFVGEFVRRGTMDSLAARVELDDVSDAQALDVVRRWAWARSDTLALLRMYRSRLTRRRFNEDEARHAILLGIDNQRAAPLVRDLARMWLNRRPDPFYVNALAFVSMELGLEEDARRWLASTRTDDGISPAREYNAIRLALGRGDTTGVGARLARLAAELGVVTDRARWDDDLPFARVLGLESNEFSSLVWLGDNRRRLGRLRDAIDAYQTAADQRPQDLALQNNIATAFLQLGDTAEAAQRYRNIIAIDSMFVEAWINLALHYARTGQMDRADQAMSQAVSIAPDHPMVRRLRSRGRR